jgi:hypothetical protein
MVILILSPLLPVFKVLAAVPEVGHGYPDLGTYS